MRLLLFQTKSQPGFAYKKACNAYLLVVHWGNIVKKNCQMQGVWKKDKKERMTIWGRGLSLEGEAQTFSTLCCYVEFFLHTANILKSHGTNCHVFHN